MESYIATALFEMEGHPVADQGFFSRGGGSQLPRWGRQPIIWPNFYRKLHENERIWTKRGSACPWRHPLDPPMPSIINYNVIVVELFLNRTELSVKSMSSGIRRITET